MTLPRQRSGVSGAPRVLVPHHASTISPGSFQGLPIAAPCEPSLRAPEFLHANVRSTLYFSCLSSRQCHIATDHSERWLSSGRVRQKWATLSRLSNGSDGTRFERRPCFLSFEAILSRPECHLVGIVLALIDCFFRTNNPAIRQTLFQSRLQNLLRPEARKVYCSDPGATNHVALILPFSAVSLS
jgi:hypothetical protein